MTVSVSASGHPKEQQTPCLVHRPRNASMDSQIPSNNEAPTSRLMNAEPASPSSADLAAPDFGEIARTFRFDFTPPSPRNADPAQPQPASQFRFDFSGINFTGTQGEPSSSSSSLGAARPQNQHVPPGRTFARPHRPRTPQMPPNATAHQQQQGTQHDGGNQQQPLQDPEIIHMRLTAYPVWKLLSKGWSLWSGLTGLWTVRAVFKDPFPPCSTSLLGLAVAGCAARFAQAFLSYAFAQALPNEVGRRTWSVHQRLVKATQLWRAQSVVRIGQIFLSAITLWTAGRSASCAQSGSFLLDAALFVCITDLLAAAVPNLIFTSYAHLASPIPLQGPLFGASPEQRSRLRPVRLTEEDIKDVCPICLDNMGPRTPATLLPCKHVFHSECLEQHLEERSDCPLCRAAL